MSYFEITSAIAILSDTITKLYNDAFPDDFAEVAKRKQYTTHRFCGIKCISLSCDIDGTVYVTIDGVDMNGTPYEINKNAPYSRLKPIANIIRFYNNCSGIYIAFNLGRPSHTLFNMSREMLYPNQMGSKFSKVVISPMDVDIDKLFSKYQENMAEFLVDCLRLDPIIGSYMPYKEKY